MSEREQQLEKAVNSLLLFFNPTYDRPEALEVYCEAFHLLNGWYPRAWYKLKRLPAPQTSEHSGSEADKP